MLIDVHAHLSPHAYPESPSRRSAGQWPCMTCADGGSTLSIGSQPFRTLDTRSWDISRRLEDMDRDGVAIQVLSPMPELLSYWLNVEDAQILLDHVNGQIAEYVAAAPNRFRGLGAVPLQDPERAAAALPVLRQKFGMSGVEIGSNICGALLGDPCFDAFFAAAAEQDMAVFVHALHPIAAKAVEAGPPFTVFCGFPTDVGMAAASLLLAGTLDRHPRLRIGFSHGGGTLAAMLGRLDTGWRHNAALLERMALAPSAQAARMFYDSNCYDSAFVAHLAARVAPGQVFLGTDYPYDIMQRDPATYIAGIPCEPGVVEDLRYGAAGRFLAETFVTSAEKGPSCLMPHPPRR